MSGASLGRHPGRPGYAHEDSNNGSGLAATDPLAKKSGSYREKQDEPKPERRLDERQRREQQRTRLKRPAERANEASHKPARAPDKANEQRRPKPVRDRNGARLKRLHRDLQAVKGGGRAGADDPKQERAHRARLDDNRALEPIKVAGKSP
jgi:hypothetical protein